MRFFFATFFLLFHCAFFAQRQNSVTNQIHTLLDSSNYYFGLDNLKSLKFSRKANIIAQQHKNPKEIAQTSLFVARSLYLLEMYKQSLEYINIGKPLAVKNKDILMVAQFKELQLSDYSELGLKQQAFQQHKEIVDLLSDKTDDESKLLLSRVYGYLGQDYLEAKNFKSANEFINKALKLFPQKPGETFNEINGLYLMKGYNHLSQGQKDSAYYYFTKNYSEESIKKLCFYQQLTALGDYYYELKKYSEALSFFKQSLNMMNECQVVDLEYSTEINKKMSKIYEYQGNKELKEKYLNEYYKESIKLKERSNKNIPAVVNMILNDQKEEQQSKNIILIASASSIGLIIIFFSYWKYHRLRKKKKKIIREKENNNEYLTRENEHLTKEVEEKKFLELINLAKNNHPEFLVLFEELYPTLINELKKLNPKIRNSELAFCALAYLNFSTKDISEYTFVSIATVQSRKNRFRKKYNIPSDEDFNIWMRELGENNS